MQQLNDGLEQQLLNAVLAKMNVEEDGLSDTTCSWCGQASWGILALTRLYSLAGKRTIPTVSLACTSCGNILTFDLKSLGFENIEALLEASL